MAVKITPEYLTFVEEWINSCANTSQAKSYESSGSGDLEETAKLLRVLGKDISCLYDLDDDLREGLFYSRLEDFKSRRNIEDMGASRGTRIYIGNVVNEIIEKSLVALPIFEDAKKLI